MKINRTEILHNSFEIGILLKGVDAFLETVSGVFLFLVTPNAIKNIILLIAGPELSEDPNDLVFTHLVRLANNFSVSSQDFVAFYLAWHGIVKLFIVASLWKGKLWAYPTGIAFFLIFIAYQVYRFLLTNSFWLILLTIFDVVIIYLTWVEYRRIRLKLSKK